MLFYVVSLTYLGVLFYLMWKTFACTSNVVVQNLEDLQSGNYKVHIDNRKYVCRINSWNVRGLGEIIFLKSSVIVNSGKQLEVYDNKGYIETIKMY